MTEKTGHGRKSWRQKLVDKKGYPKILRLEKKFPCYNAGFAGRRILEEEGDKRL